MIRNKFIILKKTKYSESDLILRAISKQGEKVGFIAKGALNSKKRFPGGVLDPTHYVTLGYSAKKTQSQQEGRLFYLNEACLENSFDGLRTDYSRLEMGLYFVSVIDRLSLEGSIDSEGLFNILGHALNELQISEDLNILKFHFEAKLLHQQGVLPEDLQLTALFKTSLKQHMQLKQKIKASEIEALKQKTNRTMSQYLTA